jgi:tetratricopeptide (TPR) repeat protein
LKGEIFLTSLERGRVPSVPSPRPIAGKELQLIDRIEEMTLLRDAVDRAVRGEGNLVLVCGEAGIGKTRLAREVGAYARLREMQVLYGRCPALFKMDGVPPYVLWGEVIRDYLEKCSPEQLYRVIGFYPAELIRLVPELRQKLGAIPQSLSISPELERDRLFEAVSEFITNIAKETPLLVVLDDLQWTDQTSLLLLHYLARGVYKTPLVLLGAYRETDIDDRHPMSPVLTELNRERLLQSVLLKRMSLNDTSEMIKQVLEQDDVPKEFCELVYEKTQGNPFFVEEVIKSLKEEQIIHREENKWKIAEVSRIEFPKTVKSVIKARINRLDDECQSVLTMASFIGNDFTCEALRGVMGIEEDKLLELIDKILKTELFKHRVIRGEDVCSFADIIVRDVAYEEVGPFRRKKLHDTVGCALEKVYAEKVDEHLGELASHFLEGGNKDKALNYFLKAGDKASKIFANVEAVSYFQSALKLLEEKEAEMRKRAIVLERLGDIKKLVGEYDACLKYWDEGFQIWSQVDERGNVSRLHRKMANVLWENTGDAEKARGHHEKALKILETEPESIELASLYEDMAHMYYYTESMAKALSCAEKALELAKKLNDCAAMASSYSSLGEIAFSASGDLKKAIECHEKALKIALDNGFVDTTIRAYNNLGMVIPWEEQERALDCFEKGFELAKKAGAIRWVSSIGNILSSLYVGMGNTDKTVFTAEESIALDRKTGNMPNLSSSLNHLGSAYIILGEWDKAEQCFNESLKISQRLDLFRQIAFSSYDLGILYGLYKGEYAKAEEFLERAVAKFERAEAKYNQVWLSTALVWVYIQSGKLREANDLLSNIERFAIEKSDTWLAAIAEMLRGGYFRAQRKWEESIEQFEKSREYDYTYVKRWVVYFFARFYLNEYARVYLERNQEGDREKALDLLKESQGIFQKLGAKKEIERTMKTIEALQHPSISISEETISPVSYEFAEVRSSITATPRELKLGESLELEIEVTNARKEGAFLLTKITEVVPEGFAIAKKPELYRMEGNCLIMREKRLDPSGTEVVKLVLTPKIQGTFHIKPKIVYLDENGKETTCALRPVSITVKELGIKGWLKGER